MPILNSAYFTECRRHIVIPCGKVCRIKNRHTFRILPILKSAYFKSMLILNSSYHAVKYAELRIGSILKVCRFVIRHITQTETQTETEANFTHPCRWLDCQLFAHSLPFCVNLPLKDHKTFMNDVENLIFSFWKVSGSKILVPTWVQTQWSLQNDNGLT